MNLYREIEEMHKGGMAFAAIARHINELYPEETVYPSEIWRYLQLGRTSKRLSALYRKHKGPNNRQRIELQCQTKEQRKRCLRNIEILGGRDRLVQLLAENRLIERTT